MAEMSNYLLLVSFFFGCYIVGFWGLFSFQIFYLI
jgi:hypothetical protein